MSYDILYSSCGKPPRAQSTLICGQEIDLWYNLQFLPPLSLCYSSKAVHFQKNRKKRFDPTEHTVPVLQRSPQRLSTTEPWGGGTGQNDPGMHKYTSCIVDNESWSPIVFHTGSGLLLAAHRLLYTSCVSNIYASYNDLVRLLHDALKKIFSFAWHWHGFAYLDFEMNRGCIQPTTHCLLWS